MIEIKDKYGRKINYLRVSVTDKCNLRCIYCIPENHKDFLDSKDQLTFDEIFRIIKETVALGISKVRITGGEPLVRNDTVDLIGMINRLEGIEEICMTTNGILLYDKLEKLAVNGLNRVNISLDTLNQEKFNLITRGGDLKKVILAIDKCIEKNIKVKINIVIMDGINNDEIIDFVKLTKSKPIDIRFIELMPIGEGRNYKSVSNSDILQKIKNNNLIYTTKESNEIDGPAKYIKLTDGIGRVGFISAMSNCFCNKCNRVRLTPDGFLKQCLNWNTGINLKEEIRKGINDNELNKIIKDTIYEKPKNHLFKEENKNEDKRHMYEIGG